MKSAAPMIGTPIDCRKIILSGTFYSLLNIQANELVQDYYSFIQECFSENCVMDWEILPRKLSVLSDKTALVNLQKQHDNYGLFLDAYVKSNTVFNKRTLNSFNRYKEHPAKLGYILGTEMSIDYPNYYDKIIKPFVKDSKEYKWALLQLFNLEKMVHFGEYYSSDIQGTCLKRKIDENGELFIGEFSLSIGLFCLEEENSWTNRLLEFGKELSLKYQNVNIQIEINPRIETYMSYYGKYINPGIMNKNDTILWDCATHLYFTGVGWAHIASPATLELETIRFVNPKNGIVHKEALSNGARMIRVKTPISDVRISDLKEMKRHIYSLIMPRKNKPGVQERPRCYWEMIPVFDNELTIIDGEFHLEHKGSIDQQKVYDLMKVKLVK